MTKFIFLLFTFIGLSGVCSAQRVQGTLKSTANPNEVTVSIKPNSAFVAQISNLIVSVQIPTSVGPRPVIAFNNLQPSLFASWDQLDQDQGDGYYTWGFNCASPGGSNSTSTNWSATELDVLTISFIGASVPPFTARVCHYLDGGSAGYAIFYVETSLAVVNNGVLSDWGNLFYGTGASNGSTAAGSIGVPNANYSFTTVSNVTLPVKFVGFNVAKKDKDALLTWQIENETAQADAYEIERSTNGVDFVKVDAVAAKNNGNSTNTYNFTDANFTRFRSSGVVYYRIKQMDKDGRFTLTNIKNLRLDTKNIAISVYPNPIKNFATVSFDLLSDAAVKMTINDASGKQVQTIPLQLFKGVNTKKIDMSTLTAGAYMLSVNTGEEIQNIALVKVN
ncbi:MAG: T9SS type A sorting domain-containing protein [Ferruginibacter sp.]